jgi:D-glycero-D-manno-heptose 1,7-bisphosphate phosphatase
MKQKQKPSDHQAAMSDGKPRTKTLKKAIFFDRDGTLIEDKVYLNDPDAIVYLPDVFKSLERLRDAGYVFVIVTNQSGIPRGLVTVENLEEIHRRIAVKFRQHGIEFVGMYYAPYSVESNHEMRKPNAGMLLRAAAEHALDLQRSWMIGDRITDVEAGRRVGCRTVLLSGVESAEAVSRCEPDAYVSNLVAMSDAVLQSDLVLAQTGLV